MVVHCVGNFYTVDLTYAQNMEHIQIYVFLFPVTVHTGPTLTYTKLLPFCPALLWTTLPLHSNPRCRKRQTLLYSDYVTIFSAFILSGCLSGL